MRFLGTIHPVATINEDGNLLGRALAVLVLGAAGFGVHRLLCADASCPLIGGRVSCCAGAAGSAPAAPEAKALKPAARPAPAKPSKPAPAPAEPAPFAPN